MSAEPYFELSKIYDTETLLLQHGSQQIKFGIRELTELKREIRGWELRYYGSVYDD